MIACFGGWWTVHRWPPKCPSVKRPRPRPIFRVPIQKMSQNLCSNWVKTDDWQFYAFEILGAIPACSKSLQLNCIKTHHNTSQTKTPGFDSCQTKYLSTCESERQSTWNCGVWGLCWLPRPDWPGQSSPRLTSNEGKHWGLWDFVFKVSTFRT